MHALVTGASGFIGPHVVQFLQQQGLEVSCLVRRTSNLERLTPLKPQFIHGDVLCEDDVRAAIEGVDRVYHLAGITKGFSHEQMMQINGDGVGVVAKACAQRETPPTLVVLSSLAAAGPAPRERPLVETDVSDPISKYGITKLRGETAAREFADQVPISVVRSPIVFGEGDLDGLALFQSIKMIRAHMVPTLRNYHFSMVHAGDLANAIWLAGERGGRLDPGVVDAGLYYVAAERNPTYAQYGKLIGATMGMPHIVPLHIVSPVVRLVGGINELASRITGKPQILNWDKAREALAGSWACSPERLQRETGFEVAATLEQRMRQTLMWYLDKGHLKLRKIPPPLDEPMGSRGAKIQGHSDPNTERAGQEAQQA